MFQSSNELPVQRQLPRPGCQLPSQKLSGILEGQQALDQLPYRPADRSKTMGDSWEDSLAPPPVKPASLQQRGQAKSSGLNPNASTFSFSPSANSFTPGGTKEPSKPPPGFTMPTYPPPPGGTTTASPSPSTNASATEREDAADPQSSASTRSTPAEASKPSEREATENGQPSGEPPRSSEKLHSHCRSAAPLQIMTRFPEQLQQALKQKHMFDCAWPCNLQWRALRWPVVHPIHAKRGQSSISGE